MLDNINWREKKLETHKNLYYLGRHLPFEYMRNMWAITSGFGNYCLLERAPSI